MTETDPTGRNAHEPGAKLDMGKVKPRMFLAYFPRALAEVARVSEFGAMKYTEGGWRTVPDGVQRYRDAKARHELAIARGEETDPDSGLLHAAHEAWNALATLELMLQEGEKADGEAA